VIEGAGRERLSLPRRSGNGLSLQGSKRPYRDAGFYRFSLQAGSEALKREGRKAFAGSNGNPVRLIRMPSSDRACRLGNKLKPRVTWNRFSFSRKILRLTFPSELVRHFYCYTPQPPHAPQLFRLRLLFLLGDRCTNTAMFNSFLRIVRLFQWPPTRKIVTAVDTPSATRPQGDLQSHRQWSMVMMRGPFSQVRVIATRASRK
jgi:hypothetical protein